MKKMVSALVGAMMVGGAWAQTPETVLATQGPLSVIDGETIDRFDRPIASPSGNYWMTLLRYTGSSSSDAVFVAGQGLMAVEEWQEGMDVVIEGRTATTFDRYVSINDNGQWAGLVNLNAGASSDDEIVLAGNFGGSKVFTVEAREGTAVPNQPGLIYGSAAYAPNVANDGTYSFGFTVTGPGITSSNDLFHFRDNTFVVDVQEATSVFSGSPLAFDDGTNSYQVSGNKQHWLIRGDLTDGTDVLVVDGAIVAAEGQDIGGAGAIELITGDQEQLNENGDWFLRGRVAGGVGFAAISGVIVGLEGEPVPGGDPNELWDGSDWTSSSATTFFINVGNNLGDYVVGGFTNNPDDNRNAAWVLNGETVILRAGEQLDLDGDGFLDNAFVFMDDLTSASPTALGGFLTDDFWFYATVDVRNAAGQDLGEAFIRVRVPGLPGDLNCDGLVNAADIDGFVAAVIGDYDVPGCTPLNADTNGDGVVNAGDIDSFVAAVIGGG